MKRQHIVHRRAFVAGALAAGALPAAAQGKYPDKPIRFVIPFPPGGPTDIIGRMMAEKLAVELGQQVIPDNRAGASGAIGATEVARARPDGYTLLLGTSSTQAVNPTTMVNPTYDALKDFSYVGLIGVNPAVLAAHPSMPDTLKGMIELMRANPGKYSYGSSGQGGITHLASELFKQMAGGLNVVHVPYRGSGPALQDVLAGNLAWMFETISTTLPQHRSGKLRILGVALAKRTAAAQDIPTIAEAGVPGFEAYTFNVVAAPGGTPRPVIDTLHAAHARIMADTAFVAKLEQLAVVPTIDSTPESAASFVMREIDKWAPIVKSTGTRIE